MPNNSWIFAFLFLLSSQFLCLFHNLLLPITLKLEEKSFLAFKLQGKAKFFSPAMTQRTKPYEIAINTRSNLSF